MDASVFFLLFFLLLLLLLLLLSRVVRGSLASSKERKVLHRRRYVRGEAEPEELARSLLFVAPRATCFETDTLTAALAGTLAVARAYCGAVKTMAQASSTSGRWRTWPRDPLSLAR
jgi:hypothetical protein